jgi:hypothetical protein
VCCDVVCFAERELPLVFLCDFVTAVGDSHMDLKKIYLRGPLYSIIRLRFFSSEIAST